MAKAVSFSEALGRLTAEQFLEAGRNPIEQTQVVFDVADVLAFAVALLCKADGKCINETIELVTSRLYENASAHANRIIQLDK